jgi:hypothetical protein
LKDHPGPPDHGRPTVECISGADANSAHLTANSSGVYANAAFSAANTADQKALSSGSYANSAYNTSNSSSSYANSAYIHANSAFLTQNTSGVYANSAFGTANTADQKAVSAGVYANSAFGVANNKFNSTGGTISGDVNITGSLTVSGPVTYINSNQLNIGDNVINLNADIDPLDNPTENAGINVDRGFEANSVFIWNENVDAWLE